VQLVQVYGMHGKMKTMKNNFQLMWLLFFISLNVTLSTNGQLNTGSPLYLGIVGAVSSSKVSPYEITKSIAQETISYEYDTDHKYMTVEENNLKFAVFRNSKGKKTAYQILIINSEFSVFCEHYVEKLCNCSEGLHVFSKDMEEPIRVRKLLPFSLIANLIDEINFNSDLELQPQEFEDVCEVLNYVEKQ
jgi:hypothetical protein